MAPIYLVDLHCRKVFGGFLFMAIYKSKHASNFTVVPNDVFKSGIDITSVGLLVYLLSLPHDWVVHKTTLHKQIGVGRDKLDRMFKDLQAHGYILSIKHQTKNGFDYEHIVYDKPYNGEKEISQNFTPSTNTPPTEKPSAGESQLLNTNILNKQNNIYANEQNTFQVDISFDDFWNNYSSKLTDGNIARKKQAITAWNKLNPEEKQKAIDYACLVKKMDTPKDFVTSPDKLLNLKRFNERPHEHVTSVKPKEDLELFKYQSRAEVISLIIQSQVNLIKSYRAYLACCNELGNNPLTEKEFFDLK